MTLRVFVPTVGEPSTISTIARIRRYIPDAQLTVFYETLGHSVSDHFYLCLRDVCDDVIVSRTNHGIVEVCNFGLMCLRWDYFLLVLADVWINEQTYQRLMNPFEQYNKVACAGGWRGRMAAPLIWASRGVPDTYPDGPLLISRAAIDDVGALSTSFHGHGHGFFEWHMRTQARGWKEAIVDDVFQEQGTWHDGRDKNPEASNEIRAGEPTLQRCREKSFQSYDWWRSDL